MKFEWDPAKNDTNFTDRGFDFAFASRVFEGRTVEVEDRRKDYGERRMVAIGLIDGRLFTVVYTDRTTRAGAVRHIITAWRSNNREKARYHRSL